MEIRTAIVATLLLAGCAAAVAQGRPPSTRPHMDRISGLVGEWKGEGWFAVRGQRMPVASEERVESRLDGEALLIEGVHRSPASGLVVHHALALVSWDSRAGVYRFSTAGSGGRGGNFTGRLEGANFVWTIPSPKGDREQRYTIVLGAPDRWFEYGEASTDGGQTWTRFFEMDLARVR